MDPAASLAFLAIISAAVSGLPGQCGGSCTCRRWTWLPTAFMGLAGLAALAAALAAWVSGPVWQPAAAGTPLAGCARLMPNVDGLSALFLAATGLVAMASSLFGAGYWRDQDHPHAPLTRLGFGLTVAGIMAVEVAGDSVSFLCAWEVMALAAFFLVATQHREGPVRSAAWLYLVCTRVATLCLIAGFALWWMRTGQTGLTTLPAGFAGSRTGTVVFLLLLVGFGFKAGVVPLHFWLPPAHAAAPAQVSALMSGVLIKTGIYGICRFVSLVPDAPLWWGVLIFCLGGVSAVLGVVWALGSHDLKRLLAYHSIENIGIILLGLGLALIGRSLGRPELMLLGAAGGLLHVLNHALFKSLLFLGAGAVDHACHTRALDRLGGLARTMPTTTVCFLVGAAAIVGLPPLNGFVSEWLVYLGLFASGRGIWPWAILGLTALVLTGGLALACFTKAAGVVFLGEPRSTAARLAQEAGRPERAAMLGLAGLCLAIGLGLPVLVQPLERAATALVGQPVTGLAAATQPLWLTAAGVGLGVLMLLLWWRMARSRWPVGRSVTWDCGYAAPDPRMQYTATSFAAPLTGGVQVVLQPEREVPVLHDEEGPARAERLFPAHAAFHDHPRDPVLDRLLRPLAEGFCLVCRGLRIVQSGWMSLYLLYIVVTLVLLLLWSL